MPQLRSARGRTGAAVLRRSWITLCLLLCAGGGLAAPEAPLTPTSAATLETLDQLHRQLDELRRRIQGMEGKLRESAAARRAADQARMDAERRLAEGMQALEGAQATLERLASQETSLTARLADQTRVIERLAAELDVERQRSHVLAAQLDKVRSKLPESEGGSMTAEAARTDGAAAYAALRQLVEAPGPMTSAEHAQAVGSAEAALQRQQLKLARITDARSIYQVRSNDSLAAISSRFYGTSGEWRTLYEANRHLLDNPNELLPGMALVVP